MANRNSGQVLTTSRAKARYDRQKLDLMIKTNALSCLQLTTLGTNPTGRRLALFGTLALCVTLPIKALAQMNATPPQIAVPALVGLWDFSGIRRDPDVPAESVDVRVNPSTGAAVIARLDEKGISSADGSKRFCSWAGDHDFGDPVPPRGCIYAESGYEIASVVVFEQQGKWLRIALDNSATRFGWVMADDAFHPLSDLLRIGRLTYLTPLWNRRLYDAPDTKADVAGSRVSRLSARATNGDFTQPYRAVRTVVVQGRLWLRVELLDEVCNVDEPRVIDTGWVPAQSATGEQWAWFWSRGC